MRKFYTYILTHNTFQEGGRKTHIMVEDRDGSLCGCKNGSSTLAEVDIDWLSQPDPDREICWKCLKKCVKMMDEDCDKELIEGKLFTDLYTVEEFTAYYRGAGRRELKSRLKYIGEYRSLPKQQDNERKAIKAYLM